MVADRFRLRYKLTPEHYRDYLKIVGKRQRRGMSVARILLPLLGGLALGALTIYLQSIGIFSSRDVSVLLIGVVITVLLIGAATIIAHNRMIKGLVGAHDALTGDFTLVAYQGGGIQITGRHMSASYDWPAFIDLTQAKELLVLWVDQGVGVIVSGDAFSSDEERQQFVFFVTNRINANKQPD